MKTVSVSLVFLLSCPLMADSMSDSFWLGFITSVDNRPASVPTIPSYQSGQSRGYFVPIVVDRDEEVNLLRESVDLQRQQVQLEQQELIQRTWWDDK